MAPFQKPTNALRGDNQAVWERALAMRQDSSSIRQLKASAYPTRDAINVDALRDWLLSDSLDWDAVERARDEGWR